jgi:hypothetical protein
MKGPLENIEFVARKLLGGPSERRLDGLDGSPDDRYGRPVRSVLLGSPIYAALADAEDATSRAGGPDGQATGVSRLPLDPRAVFLWLLHGRLAKLQMSDVECARPTSEGG